MAIFLDDSLHTLLGVQFLHFIDCNKNVSILFVHRELLCDGAFIITKKCKCIGLPFSFESNINEGGGVSKQLI